MNKKERRAGMLLLLTSLIWGTAFVAQGAVADVLGAFTFTGIRTLIGAMIMVPVYFIMKRISPEEAKRTTDRAGLRSTLLGGLICGVFMLLGSALQQLGITKYALIYGTTAVGKAGFITALYVIFVPILGLFIKRKAGLKIWISVNLM